MMAIRGPTYSLGLLGLFFASLVTFTFTIGGGQVTGPGLFLSLAVVALGVTARLLFQSARALVPGVGERDDEERVVGRRKKELEREYQAIKRALKELELDHSMGKLSDGDYGEIRGRYRERAVRILRRLDQGQDFHKQIELDLRARRQAMSAHEPNAAGPASAVGKKPKAARAEAAAPDNAGPAQEKSPAKAGDCPSCATGNDIDAVFCKKCGTRLSPS